MRTPLPSLFLFLILLPVGYLSARVSFIEEEDPASTISPKNDHKYATEAYVNRLLGIQEIPYYYETPNNGTVRLTAQNNTGVNITGDVIREGPISGEIITEFSIAPGDTYIFIDDDVLPGTTYLYVFEYFIEGNPIPVINLDYITPAATMPALGSFNLIASSYDQAYDVLRDGKIINIDNTNIQVEANDDYTGSVIFYLNGKRYNDNTYPFSLFGDVSGDYKKGRLTDGEYTLTAIAYPGRNGKGIPGDTAAVNFMVDIQYEDRQVNIFPNPSSGNTTVEVSGAANSAVEIEIAGISPVSRSIVYKGLLDDTGTLHYAVSPLNLPKGIYVISVRLNDKVIQKRLIVER